MEGEQYSNEKIICPYCDYEHDTEFYDNAYGREEGFDTECEECEKKFYVSPFCSWSWTTNQDCEKNGEKHDWKDTDEDNKHIGKKHGDSTYCKCSKCHMTEYIKL